MKKNKLFFVFMFIGLLITSYIIVASKSSKKTLTITESSLLREMTIDEKIKEAELIVIGEVKTILPSRWKAPDGKDSKNASPEEVFQAGGLFTDSVILINQILKSEIVESVIRVRSYSGEIEKVRWVSQSEPSFVTKQVYLLFLEKDIGPTANVDPGDYVSVNSNTAVYKIVDSKAISADDEWVLEELIAYIQKSLSTEALSPTLTPSSTELLIETLTPSPAETATPTP